MNQNGNPFRSVKRKTKGKSKGKTVTYSFQSERNPKERNPKERNQHTQTQIFSESCYSKPKLNPD